MLNKYYLRNIIVIYQILLPWSSVQEKAFVVDLEKRDGGLGLSVSVSTTGVFLW